MAITTTHPAYEAMLPDWEQMIHTYQGARIVKLQGTKYLPATPGQVLDGQGTSAAAKGDKSYQSYKQRAHYPEFVQEAVDKMLGILNKKEPTIKIPARLEGMLDNATTDGEGIRTLLRRVHEAQLTAGRMGMLLEAPDGQGPDALPYVALYDALSIINWDTGLREQGRRQLELVVLDETEYERVAAFTWERKKKHRVLMLNREDINSPNQRLPAGGVYQVAVTKDDRDPAPEEFKAPQIAGRTLEKIPFVFVNPCDLVPEPDRPPLLGLSNLALTVYRGEADYRQTLFMQGQETLVIIGGRIEEVDGEQPRVGAGAMLEVASGGDAKYVGVSADGLAEMRTALENDTKRAAEMGAKLLNFDKDGQQSGEALSIRSAGQTATLDKIARSSAEAVKRILKYAAEWVGANPEEVEVEPNLEFVKEGLAGKDLLDFMSAKTMGAPISNRTIHDLMVRREVTKMTYEDELEEIDQEEPLAVGGPGDPSEEEDADDTAA